MIKIKVVIGLIKILSRWQMYFTLKWNRKFNLNLIKNIRLKKLSLILKIILSLRRILLNKNFSGVYNN